MEIDDIKGKKITSRGGKSPDDLIWHRVLVGSLGLKEGEMQIFFFFFFASPTACGLSSARDQTYTTALTQATAVTREILIF